MRPRLSATQPARLTAGSGSFAITTGTRIYVDSENAELSRTGEVLSQEIKRAAGVQPPVVPAVPGKQGMGGIYLTLRQPVNTLGAEGYRLSVRPARVVLAATKPQGLFLGAQTIRQLLPTQRSGAASLPAVEVVDKPRYSWRGMHLDVSRHFFPVEFVKKYIDYLALHKLNTFHWHLTDDQGWRIEIMLAVLVYFSSLPEIDTDREDKTVAEANTSKTSVLQFPHLLLGALAMFFYVGVEVIAGDTIISYGAARGIALTTAKFFPACTMAAMTVGYLVGIVAIPKYPSQEKALQVSPPVAGTLFAPGAGRAVYQWLHVGAPYCPAGAG